LHSTEYNQIDPETNFTEEREHPQTVSREKSSSEGGDSDEVEEEEEDEDDSDSEYETAAE
jgi:hypothetical protein